MRFIRTGRQPSGSNEKGDDLESPDSDKGSPKGSAGAEGPDKGEEDKGQNDEKKGGADEDDEDHSHFPPMGSQNKYQKVLETMEVDKATVGLVNSTWTRLYQTPAEAVIQAYFFTPVSRFMRMLLTRLHQRISHVCQRMVEETIEGSFDSEEFLEGASSAFTSMFACLGEKDFTSLRQMASERVVDRMQIALFELEAAHEIEEEESFNLGTAPDMPLVDADGAPLQGADIAKRHSKKAVGAAKQRKHAVNIGTGSAARTMVTLAVEADAVIYLSQRQITVSVATSMWLPTRSSNCYVYF
eukprot:gene20183-26920_t